MGEAEATQAVLQRIARLHVWLSPRCGPDIGHCLVHCQEPAGWAGGGRGKRNEGAEWRVAQHSPITTMWRQTLPAELSVYSANELLHALFGSKREVLLLLIL